MNFNVENLSAAVTAFVSFVGFACAAFKYIVIKPLQHSIDGLQKSVNVLSGNMAAFEKEKDEIDKRLVKTEESTKSAHHRIDDICRRGKR